MTTPRENPAQRRANQSLATHDKNLHGSRPAWEVFRGALVSGTVAAILSTLVVTVFSAAGDGTAASGTNASSQWVWGEQAHMHHGLSFRYTLLGFVIHHASSIFWACAYELATARTSRALHSTAIAVGVAVVAYLVDYHVVPARLSPGFDRHISAAGMFAAYSAFALGLALASLWRFRKARH